MADNQAQTHRLERSTTPGRGEIKASELLLQSAEPFDKACMMVRELELENERLREALRLSTNGLRHCSRWNISEEKERAIMTQVIANEALLTPT